MNSRFAIKRNWLDPLDGQLTRFYVTRDAPVRKNGNASALYMEPTPFFRGTGYNYPLERLLPRRVWFTRPLIYTDYGAPPHRKSKYGLPSRSPPSPFPPPPSSEQAGRRRRRRAPTRPGQHQFPLIDFTQVLN